MKILQRITPLDCQNKGMSLVELMIASVILIMASLGIAKFLRTSSTAYTLNINRVKATELVEKAHAYLTKGVAFDQLKNTYTQFPNIPNAGRFNLSAEIGDLSPYDTRSATITVSWRSILGEKKEQAVYTLKDEGGTMRSAGGCMKGRIIDRDDNGIGGIQIEYENADGKIIWDSISANDGQVYIFDVIQAPQTQIKLHPLYQKMSDGSLMVPARPRYYLHDKNPPTYRENGTIEISIDSSLSGCADMGTIQLHPVGRLYAEVKTLYPGETSYRGISGYSFAAVPYELVTNKLPDPLPTNGTTQPGLFDYINEFRLRERHFSQTGPDGRAWFNNLTPGQWFIFPLGRTGSILSGASGWQSYEDPASVSDEAFAFPAVVRHFDYDFVEDPASVSWQGVSGKEQREMDSESTDIPVHFPDRSLLINVESKFFQDPSNTRALNPHWDSPAYSAENRAGSLIFQVEYPGNLIGNIMRGEINSGAGPYIQPGSHPYSDVKVEAEKFAGIYRRSAVAETGSSQYNRLLISGYNSFVGITYLSDNWLPGFFPELSSPGRHSGVSEPVWYPAVLNKSNGPGNIMAGKSNSQGQYSIHSLVGSVATFGGYKNKEFHPKVQQDVSVALSDLPLNDSQIFKNILVFSTGASSNPLSIHAYDFSTSSSIVLTLHSGQDNHQDFMLVPKNSLAEIAVTNTDASQNGLNFTVAADYYDTATNQLTHGSLGTSSLDGSGFQKFQSDRKIIPSISSSDKKIIDVSPLDSAGGTVPGTLTSRVQTCNPCGSCSDLLNVDVAFSAGGNDFVSGFFNSSQVQVPTAGKYESVRLNEIVIPNRESLFSFNGFRESTGGGYGHVFATYEKSGYLTASADLVWVGPGADFRHDVNPAQNVVTLYEIFEPPLTVDVVDGSGMGLTEVQVFFGGSAHSVTVLTDGGLVDNPPGGGKFTGDDPTLRVSVSHAPFCYEETVYATFDPTDLCLGVFTLVDSIPPFVVKDECGSGSGGGGGGGGSGGGSGGGGMD